jgi:prefoldin subunit 5
MPTTRITNPHRLDTEIAKLGKRLATLTGDLKQRRQEATSFRQLLPLVEQAEQEAQGFMGSNSAMTILVQSAVADQRRQCEENLAQAEADVQALADEIQILRTHYAALVELKENHSS